jgi:hypothetical protein
MSAPLVERLREEVLLHRIMTRNAADRTGCRGCLWIAKSRPGSDTAYGEYAAHLADVTARVVEAWLGEQLETVEVAIRRGAHDIRHVDQSRNEARTDAVVAALRAQIGVES